MEQARAGSAGKRRGRRAAPPAGPRRPVEHGAAFALAVLATGRERVWMPLAERVAPARERALERGGAALAAFRAGPVLPWVSAHRMAVLVGGALLVSAIAMGGAAAMIASTAPVAGIDDRAVDGGERPRPGSEFTMPSPAPSSDAPTPSSTPTPTPTPKSTPSPTAPGTTDPSTEPEPTTEPEEPTAGTEDDAPGNSGNSPGADNRPEKDKG